MSSNTVGTGTLLERISPAQALGLDVDEILLPSLLEKVACVGTLLKSFRQGDVAIERLLGISLEHKRLERLNERILAVAATLENSCHLGLGLVALHGRWDYFRRHSKPLWAMSVRGSGQSMTSTAERSNSSPCWTSFMP